MTKTEKAEAVQAGCLICGDRDAEVLHELNAYRVLRCKRCSLVFLYPTPAEDVLLDYTEDAYSGKGLAETKDIFSNCRKGYSNDPVIQGYQKIIDRLEACTNGRRLLDVGCGTGVFLDIARKRGWDVTGIDACESAVRIATEDFGVKTIHGAFDAEHFSDDSFDVITMLDFIEHVTDPLKTINTARSLLKNDGHILMTTPNHRSLVYLTADRLGRLSAEGFKDSIGKLYHFSHVTVFDPDSIRFLIDKGGFTVHKMWQESPYLGRYAIPKPTKFILTVINILSKPLNLQSRIGVIARKKPC